MENILSKPKIIRIKNTKTGVTYLYQNQHYWDSEKQQTRNIRRCIGKLDSQTQQPIYNHRYRGEQNMVQTIEGEQASFIQSIGRILLLEKAFVQSKLSLHLKRVFSDDEAARVKGLVFYLVSEDNQLSQASRWLVQNFPDKLPLSDGTIKDLLKTLNKNRQAQFFESWAKQSSKTEHLLYDLASEASYRSHNPYLYYGHNRDKEALRQNNIVIVTDKRSMRPRNYTVLGGNMRDIPTLGILPLRMGMPSLATTTLVLNRNFYARQRIQALGKEGQKFLIRVPSQKKWLAKLIDGHKQEIQQSPSFQTREGTTLQAITIQEQGSTLVHIYYEASWREEQKRNLSNILFACRNELLDNNVVDEHQRLYDEYFEVKYSQKGYRRVVYRKEAQEGFEQSNAGYWALLTNSEEDAEQALHTYLNRNYLEAQWDNMKSEEDCRLLEVHDPYIFSGRAFLQFLSLVMTSYMDSVLKDCDAGGYKEALATMAGYARVRFENLMHESFTKPTEQQRQIATIFKLKLQG
ncbi:MAG: hypothetical protein EOM68_14755 [Spirochaetia bacterium]|nr:hypothetical protein [Spirochaetia bacterium]